MTNEIQLSSQIDAAFIAKAEDDIYRILLKQRCLFNQRWQNNSGMNKLKVLLRYLGLVLCVLGAGLCGVGLFMGKGWHGLVWASLFFMFVLLVWFFFKLPQIELKARSWTERISQKSCRKLAKKCVEQADGMVPYKAHYAIKGDSMAYYRSQSGADETEAHWQFVWNRRISGFALQTNRVTVFFKTPRSIQPKIIVLHDDSSRLKKTLDRLKTANDFIIEP